MNKKLILTGVCAALLALPLASPAAASPPGMGCEDSGHANLLNWIQRQAICDGPRYADGHWDRTRVVYTPAHTSNASSSCYGGLYSSSCTFYPAQSYDTSIQEKTTYQVSDAPGAENQPLPNEPGWLPPGTDSVR